MVKKYISVMRYFPVSTTFMLVLLFTGCTVTPTTTPPPVEERGTVSDQAVESERVEQPVIHPSPERVSTQPAVETLIAKADAQQYSGDLVAAAASLERALRIDSGNARLWSQLASVRLEQGQFWQAEGLAAKSNSLARHNLAIQSRNWRTIADARRGERDLTGARQADEMADSLDAKMRSNDL